MKNQIPIYVINAKRVPERRLYIQRQLDALKLKYEFINVDAIDKYELAFKASRSRVADLLGIDKSRIEKLINHLPKEKHNGTIPINTETHPLLGQLAITLSHIKVYNLMLKEDIGEACILEDDATLLPTFPEILQNAAELEWDILLLASQPSYFPKNLIQQKHIKRIRIFDKDLLFLSSKSSKKRDSRVQRLSEEYGFNSRLYPKQLQTIEKVLQEHDTRHSEVIKTLMPNNRRLSWVKHEHYIKYRILRRALKIYTSLQLGALPEKSGLELVSNRHCIAEPKYKPYSTTAYLVKQPTAMKWKRNALAKNFSAIDEIPWELYKNEQVKLRLITPPCAMNAYNYLIYSSRQK